MFWVRVFCAAALISVPTLSEAAGLVRGTGSRSLSLKAATVGPHYKPIVRHPRAFRRYPYNYNYAYSYGFPYSYDYPYVDAPDFLNYQMAPVEVPEPPRALNCKRTRETKIVPSAIGGTREITITRC